MCFTTFNLSHVWHVLSSLRCHCAGRPDRMIRNEFYFCAFVRVGETVRGSKTWRRKVLRKKGLSIPVETPQVIKPVVVSVETSLNWRGVGRFSKFLEFRVSHLSFRKGTKMSLLRHRFKKDTKRRYCPCLLCISCGW